MSNGNQLVGIFAFLILAGMWLANTILKQNEAKGEKIALRNGVVMFTVLGLILVYLVHGFDEWHFDPTKPSIIAEPRISFLGSKSVYEWRPDESGKYVWREQNGNKWETIVPPDPDDQETPDYSP